MKKLLAIFMLCFAVFAAKAQYVFLMQEGFENNALPTGWVAIDADGDGFNWAVMTQTEDLMSPHEGDGLVASASYDNDAGEPLYPDNWLITSGIAIPADANYPTLSWWEKGQDASYAEEHYAVYISTTGQTVADFTSDAVYEGYATGEYVQQTVDLSLFAGQTIYIAFRHYEISDMFFLNLDDIEIYTMTSEPILTAAPTTIDFGTVIIGNTSENTVTVSAFNLTTDITITTAAPFAVSLDGETFATNVTMPATSGTLYVQYAPTAAVADNGTVTLTSGDLTATIAVSGTGFECNALTVPFVENFDSYTALPVCYQFVYADENPAVNPITLYEDGTNKVIRFSSYSSTSVYDQYMISPVLQYTGTNPLQLSVKAKVTNNGENFSLGYSTTTSNIDAFVWGDDLTASNTTEYEDFSMTIPSNARYVAVHYFSNYKYYLLVDSLAVEEVTLPQILTSATDINMGYVELGNSSDVVTIPVLGALLENVITATTTAPFEISSNGTDYAVTATLPAEGGDLYVRYTPTSVGTDSAIITLAVDQELVEDVVINLAGAAYECNNALPYQTDFSDEAKNLCWTIENANNDSYEWTFSTSSAYASMHWNSSMAADDWLISPTFTLTGSEFVKFDYKTGSSYDEKFEVAIIQGSTRTIIVPEMTVRTSSYLTLDPVVLNEYTGDYQIGIHCTSDADMFYLYVTNFVVSSLDDLDSSLTVNPEAIDFGNSLYTEGMTATETVTVSAIKIHNVTASVEAPYSVSLDGTTFAASIALPDEDPISNTTTIYVQFAPTAAGNYPGVVTLTNGTTTATVNLSGEVVDCNIPATLPFIEDFEDEISACWTNTDNDGDGYTWMQMTGYEDYAHSGSGLYTSASWVSGTVLTPDNWLITPALAIPEEGAHLDFWVGPQDPSYPAEHYQVKVSTTGTNVSDFTTTLIDETLTQSTWVERVANLDFAGQNVYVAFVHNQSSDVFRINIDDINISAGIVDGIEEETAENAVAIYPNPASTMLNVHAENFDNVQVINFLGQVVYSANVTENDFQINVSNLSNGVYFIRLNGENTVTKKFVKK